MKLTNEICISFLQGSGWMYNHDKEIIISERNEAIDNALKPIEQYKEKHSKNREQYPINYGTLLDLERQILDLKI